MLKKKWRRILAEEGDLMPRKIRELTPEEIREGIEYDNFGRIKFHPDYHFNHKKPFTDEELEYICKYYDTDGPRAIGFALGRTEMTIRTKVDWLKKNNLIGKYKSLNHYV